MGAVALRTGGDVVAAQDMVRGLPAMVSRASTALAQAVGAAEILEAKAMANVVYDAAKAAARFAKAKGAFDDVMAAVYRAQADALEIEAEAKRRLADEYDAAQERGDVRSPGGDYTSMVANANHASRKPTLAEIGLTKDVVYEARRTRDTENAIPGITGMVAHELANAGLEPSKSSVAREINARLGSYSGDNEWYTPAKYVEMARTVLGAIDIDPASNETAQRVIKAGVHYTAENDGLDKKWSGKLWMNPPYSNPEIQQFVEKAISEYSDGEVTEAVILTNNSGDTGWHHQLQNACAAMCITKGRIRFESPTRDSNSPAMGQVFFYLGDDRERFRDVFSAVGKVWLQS